MNISRLALGILCMSALAPAGAVRAASAPAAPAAATFLVQDALTQGTWKGVYGSEGGLLYAGGPGSPGGVGGSSLPPYAVVSTTGSLHVWQDPAGDFRALQKTTALGRIASCWFGAGSFVIDLDLTDGLPHRVALYSVDYDSFVRSQLVEVRDADDDTLLDARAVSGFHGGVWLVWTLQGHVKFRIVQTGGTNAVASGLFFGDRAVVMSDLTAAVTALPLTPQFTASSKALLMQTLSSAALRVNQVQHAAAVTLLRSFNSSVGKFVTTGGIAPAAGAALLAQSNAVQSTLNGLNAGLSGIWKMDEGAGTTAGDGSGNGFHAGLVNAPLWVPGKSGKALEFNGASNLAAVPNFAWNSTGGVTVAFWNYVAAADVKTSSAFTFGGNGIHRFQSHAPWSDGNLYWDFGDILLTGRLATPYGAYLNKWTHVTLVSEGLGGGLMAIYLDGAKVASAPVSYAPLIPLSGAQIGAWDLSFHKGRIDDLRVYPRVLDKNEVAMLAGIP